MSGMNNVLVKECFSLVTRGKSPKYCENGIPVVSQACIYWDELRLDKAKMHDAAVSFDDYVLHENDVLVNSTGTGTLGRAAVVTGEMSGKYIADSHVTIMRPTAHINPKYFCYYMSMDITQELLYKHCVNGSTNQIELSKEKLLKFLIPVCSLEEQQKITAVLDKVSSLIAMRKKQLQKLDELVKARFVEMFEGKYATVKIGDVFSTTSGGTPSKSHPEYYEDGAIPWLSSGEVNIGVINSVRNYITQEGVDNSSAKMVPENSVVIAMYGATAGQVGLLRIATTTNQAVCSVLPNSQYVPEYLYYAIKAKKDWMISQCAGGAQPNISQGVIKRMEIINAPYEMQEQFAAFVDQTDKSKLTIQQSLDKLELMKKALMQKYFG